jgi:hypothetical protein
MMESSELKNVTISQRGNEICEALKEDGYFNSAVDAYRTAICIAIAKDLSVDESLKGTLNKWDTASVFRDPDSNIEALMILKGFSRDQVVAKGKLLAETGLRFIEEKRIANVDLLSILIGS